MALRASKRLSQRSIKSATHLLILPVAAAAFVAACADSSDTGAAGAGGGGTSSAGTSSNVSSTSTGGSTGNAGTTSVAGTGGADGTVAGSGGAADSAGSGGAGGSGGTDGTAGGDGTGGTGGAPPACAVPVSGGVDFSGLLVGPQTVEGEAATLAGAAAVAAEGSGWSGTGFADMMGSEGSMTWLIDAPATGDYVLDWTYTQDDARDMRLTVNCVLVAESVAFTNTRSWNTAWTTGGAQKVQLTKGTNKILLETNGGSGANFDSMVVSPPICALAGDAATTCEAERSLMSGAARLASEGSGWKDLGFADMKGAEGGVNWVLDAPYAGTYRLTFVYTQDDARDMTLTVNGVVAAASLPFNNTRSWNTAWASDVTYDVTLKNGVNSVQLATNGASGPNFDSVLVQGQGDGGGAGGGGVGGAGAGGGGAGGAGGGGAGGAGGGGAGGGGAGGAP